MISISKNLFVFPIFCLILFHVAAKRDFISTSPSHIQNEILKKNTQKILAVCFRGGSMQGVASKKQELVSLMALSALSGSLACVFSHPFDLTKTRLQLDGELAERGYQPVYKGWIHCFVSNWKSGGLAGLERGLTFAVLREAIVNCFRLGLYQPFLNLASGALSVGSSSQPPSLAVCIVVAALTGLIGGFFANPVDVLKVRMQTQGRGGISTGYQHTYRNSFDAFWRLLRDEGISGLLNGFGTSGLRIAVGSGVQIPAYYIFKSAASHQGFSEASPWVHALASLGSAAICVAWINPMDVVRTRLYNQPFDDAGKGKFYSSGVDAAVKIAKVEGILAFYKGALTHYMRLGPHLMLTFVFAEQFQKLGKYFKILN